MATQPPAPSSRAGWYPDPTDGRLIRYWDGHRWTAYTAPRRRESYGAPRPSSPPWWQSPSTLIPLLVTMGVIVFMLLGGLMVALTGSDEPAADAPPASVAPTPTNSSTTTPPTPTPEAEPVRARPARSIVPRVTGLSRQKAQRQLVAAGLVVTEVRELPSASPRGTVLSQSRRVGASILAGSEVILTVAAPYPQVPDVIGRYEAAAVSRLRDAGFKVTVTTETRTSGRDGVVVRQTPTGSSRAEPRSRVVIVVSSVVRTVTPPPAQDCTSGYDPCLEPAYDYDCAGGSGDGPEYAYGPIYVSGSDPYDLDSDGDGVACES